MPFCPQCGVDNPDSARFCDQCGTALVPVPASAAAPAPAGSSPQASSNTTLVTGPIVCPQCGATAIPGEAFCDNCGAPLNAPTRPAAQVPAPPYSPGLPPQPVYPAPQPVTVPSTDTSPQGSPPVAPPPLAAPPSYTGATIPGQSAAPPRTSLAHVRLVVPSTGATLPLPNSTQAVIGRADPISRYFPDIDLTAYGALDNGVGRRHARFQIQQGQVTIEDLDSTNGTFLNGQRLIARQAQVVRDGDLLQLGKLILRMQL